jgi:hypothetical protein
MLEFCSAVSVLVSFALELKVGPAGGNDATVTDGRPLPG